MNHRRMPILLSIEQKIRDADDLAGVPEMWDEVAKFWGEVRPVSAREYTEADQVRADVSHIITTRYYKHATPRMRLRVGLKTYEVESCVNMDERNRWTQWRCREVV